jgi:hypothetical protein
VLLAAAAMLTVAIRRGSFLAAACLSAPALIGGAMAAAGRRWHFYEFAPFASLLLLCGTAALGCDLAASRARWPWHIVAGAAAAVVLAVQGSRFAGAVRHYGFVALPQLRFVQSDFAALAAAARCGAYVDVDSPVHTNYILLVELTWRGVPLQWSPISWQRIVGYRPWSPPTYERLAPLRIIARDGPLPEGGERVLQTKQYDLIRMPDERCDVPPPLAIHDGAQTLKRSEKSG